MFTSNLPIPWFGIIISPQTFYNKASKLQIERGKLRSENKVIKKQAKLFNACKNNEFSKARKYLKGSFFRSPIEPNFLYNSQTLLCISAINGHGKIVSLLLDSKARIDLVNDFGFTAIFEAIKNNQIEAAKILLRRGTQTSLVDDNGLTIMHYASLNTNINILELVLEYAPEQINKQDKRGRTPLYLAAEKGMANSVKFLLKNGADPEIGNLSGAKPLDVIFSRQDLSEVNRKKFIAIIANHIQKISDTATLHLKSSPILGSTDGSFFLGNVLERLLSGYFSTSEGCEIVKKIIAKSTSSRSIGEISTKCLLSLYQNYVVSNRPASLFQDQNVMSNSISEVNFETEVIRSHNVGGKHDRLKI